MTDPTTPPPHEPAPPPPPGAVDQPRGPRGGRFGISPDIGSPTSRLIALVAVTLLYLLIALSQNLTPYLTPVEPQVGRKPQGGEFAKLMFLMEHALESMGPTGGQLSRATLTQFVSSSHPADRLQGVLVLGEADSPEAALDWLRAVRGGADADQLSGLIAGGIWNNDQMPQDESWAEVRGPDATSTNPDLVVDHDVVLDADAMETLYTVGPDGLSDDARARLVNRYGWLGKLATTPESDTSAREALFADTTWAVLFFSVAFGVIVVWGLAGLTMFIIALVMMANRRLPKRFAMDRPRPGGSVFLETFAIFLLGFGLVQISGAIIAGMGVDERTAGLLTMVAQWLLIFTLFWPVLRGVKMREWREAVGWTAPQGVFREIMAGVAGYFAGVPLLVAGMIMTVILTFVSAQVFGEPTEPPSNPILELVQSADLLTLVLLLTLATIWAPIAEETLFRGSIYRHMRGRAGPIVCGLGTALLFAFMHSYGPLMVGPLIALGFTFAMIREWRGSLIGSMTAHCLHNSTIMVIMLLAMRAMA